MVTPTPTYWHIGPIPSGSDDQVLLTMWSLDVLHWTGTGVRNAQRWSSRNGLEMKPGDDADGPWMLFEGSSLTPVPVPPLPLPEPTLRSELGDTAGRILLDVGRLRALTAGRRGPAWRLLNGLLTTTEQAALGIRSLTHRASAAERALQAPLFTREQLAETTSRPSDTTTI